MDLSAKTSTNASTAPKQVTQKTSLSIQGDPYPDSNVIHIGQIPRKSHLSHNRFQSFTLTTKSLANIVSAAMSFLKSDNPTQWSAFFIFISTYQLNLSIDISVPVVLSFAISHPESAMSEKNAESIAEFSSDIV
jgi:hypothetical protein